MDSYNKETLRTLYVLTNKRALGPWIAHLSPGKYDKNIPYLELWQSPKPFVLHEE